MLTAVAVNFTLTANAEDVSRRQMINVGEFTQLNVTDNICVDYVCSADSSGLAVFNGTSKDFSNFIFTNNGKGKLTVQTSLDSQKMPLLTVYSSSLQEVKNQGDSTVRVISLAKTPSFKIITTNRGRVIAHNLDVTTAEAKIATGNGNIIVDGTCTTFKARCVGKGEVQADHLKATDVSCTVYGTGTVGCYVDGGNLSVTGSGTGRVYYRGKPANVKVHKLGTLKAIPLE